MKKVYFFILAIFWSLTLAAAVQDLDPETVLADTMYAKADYTVPSYTEFLIAKRAAVADPSQTNLQALVDKVAALQSKENPYCMVATINGDPKTRMGFCWMTNDSITDGEVQLVAKANATAEDFDIDAIVVPATPKRTKQGLRYAGPVPYILNASGIGKKVKYFYISHKAVAENLIPGTEYSWRVGYDGHWSPIAHFRTSDDNQGEFTFLYMSDSHLVINDSNTPGREYIDEARRCAVAAANTVPEARFCVFPGDFVEDGEAGNSEWEWERWFEEALEPVIKQMPIVPTDGNHDVSPNLNYTYHFNTDNSFKDNYAVPQFDGTIYSFNYGDALFVVFSMQDYWRDNHSFNPFVSAYLEDHVAPWFKNQVIQNADKKWRLSLSHFNLFSGSDHSTDKDPMLFRACMLPVVKECEIDVALQGHDHTYEVIGPVDPDNLTPILSAISDQEDVPVDNNKNITGKKGGTYCTDDGTLYFIGATCGAKRYYPHSRARMEADYEAGKHNVPNYFDLFTGMFGQPGAPSFTKITVKNDCLEFNSYTANMDGTATLYNTMKIVRTKEHGVPQGLETPEIVRFGDKFLQNGMLFIRCEGRTYNILGQIVNQ